MRSSRTWCAGWRVVTSSHFNSHWSLQPFISFNKHLWEGLLPVVTNTTAANIKPCATRSKGRKQGFVNLNNKSKQNCKNPCNTPKNYQTEPTCFACMKPVCGTGTLRPYHSTLPCLTNPLNPLSKYPQQSHSAPLLPSHHTSSPHRPCRGPCPLTPLGNVELCTGRSGRHRQEHNGGQVAWGSNFGGKRQRRCS